MTTLPCPYCGQEARLLAAPFFPEDGVLEDDHWRLVCSHCTGGRSGRLTLWETGLALGGLLLPVALLCGGFLLYAGGLPSPWLRLAVFLLHLAPGVYLGDRVSRLVTRWRARNQLRGVTRSGVGGKTR